MPGENRRGQSEHCCRWWNGDSRKGTRRGGWERAFAHGGDKISVELTLILNFSSCDCLFLMYLCMYMMHLVFFQHIGHQWD